MSVSNIGKPNPDAWLVFGFRIRDCGYLKERRGRFSVFAFVTVESDGCSRKVSGRLLDTKYK